MIDAHKRQYWQRSNVKLAIRGASAALLTEFAADITRGGERGLILCSGQFVGAQAHRAFGLAYAHAVQQPPRGGKRGVGLAVAATNQQYRAMPGTAER